MHENIVYKNIIEKIAIPVIVLKPLYHGSEIYDYEIIYLSAGLYPDVFGMMQQEKCYTQYQKQLPPEIDWFHCISSAINKRIVITKDFLSPYAHRWFHIIFQAAENDFCVCSLQEITNSGYEMLETYNSRTTLCNKINQAMTENVFELYYQPQIEIDSHKLRGFEALIRWYDSGKWIDPDDFIPVAEETKSIIYLGKWIMKTALNTLKRLQTLCNFNGIMAINVSPVQLDDSDFIKYFAACIHKLGIDAGRVELEITEHTIMKDMNRASAILSALRRTGVSLALDDFGTGYSSLEYLQKLPFTTLKIDKSFTDEVCIKDKSVFTEIVPGVIDAVSKRGMTTIIEGVETEAQLTELRKTNCNCIQGFLVGKPMPYEQCLQYLHGCGQPESTVL
jgi:EAL domain-containing protein (putative c-di-GMP-specific phosphodiesterase class I)